MIRKLVFVHTVGSLVTLFDRLAQELLPNDVKPVHVADELLLSVVLEADGLTPQAYRMVNAHATAAEEAGASWVQLTCSSISPCADVARKLVGIPVLKIDEPMIDQAIGLGRRVGIAATVRTTLGPTQQLVEMRASALGRGVTVDPVLCPGAYEALQAGDAETHDRIVREALVQLGVRNDVVVLAQASMARVADTIAPEEQVVPILSSPRLAMEHLARVTSG
ncbi:MAG: Asp/Glu/hydantoin racemase [Chloroflexi bacterium]|nr:Asp/Glu/hydantoin racemase [Chloroflexota bacterium]